MNWRHAVLVPAGLAAVIWRTRYDPFPRPGDNPVLDLIAYHDPTLHNVIEAWHYGAPGAAVLLAGLVSLSVWRVWFEPQASGGERQGDLPEWPISPEDQAPSVVVGEVHHPVEAREIAGPSWLVIPEKGLYTGVLIFGAVGSGKTSACMHPFARQILSWQADRPQRRSAGLVLEVKGDFCHDVRRILQQAGRGEDYLEIGLNSPWQWNPLDDRALDSYSLAYTLSTLLNQLFGKSKEPFWQQAYTNLVRWIIDLHRILPGRWVTIQDIYRCTIDAELFAEKIGEAESLVTRVCKADVTISIKDLFAHKDRLTEWDWDVDLEAGQATCALDPALKDRLAEIGVTVQTEWAKEGPGAELRERVEAIGRWYRHDWVELDAKIRTTIVEGISVFLSLFDLPEVAAIFCPPPPRTKNRSPAPQKESGAEGKEEAGPEVPAIPIRRRLPPLGELIESGKVLALNMPAGANPALSRAVGVLLKNAWMQALLRRPAQMARRPDAYYRPAVFICDEYQAFASVGEDDPSGDEKSFALSRQCRCIPILATQSISSLRSVLGGSEGWRTLIQTLRTRIFLSLSDEASARIASELCGTVPRMKPSYTFTENTSRPEVSLLSARAGGGRGSVGASKSFREVREPVFQPRDFSLLANYQAICLPYDGAQSLPARRVYLKPYYLPKETGYWRMREEGRI